MLVEIESSETTSWTPPNSDRPLIFQKGWAFVNGSKHPKEIKFTVDAAFDVGYYELNLEEVCDVREGKLRIGRLLLSPAKAPKSASVVG